LTRIFIAIRLFTIVLLVWKELLTRIYSCISYWSYCYGTLAFECNAHFWTVVHSVIPIIIRLGWRLIVSIMTLFWHVFKMHYSTNWK